MKSIKKDIRESQEISIFSLEILMGYCDGEARVAHKLKVFF